MFSSKNLITLSEGCEKVKKRDFRIIFDRQNSGKRDSISIMHSKDFGLCDTIDKNTAVLPLLSGLTIYKGRVSSVRDKVPFCFS